MDNEALALAVKFITSGIPKPALTWSWTVTQTTAFGQVVETDEEVVVEVYRRKKQIKLGQFLSPYGSGAVCPMCSGTGRIP